MTEKARLTRTGVVRDDSVIGASAVVRLWSWIFGLWCLALVTSCSPSSSHPEEPAVRAHVERYFATWSAQDMDGYGACFLPQARITFVTPQGTNTQGLTDFLHGQRLTHETASSPMSEVPLEIKISVGNRIATAAVKWELRKQGGNRTGMDFFTLAKTPEGWRIVALVWEQD